MRNEWKAWVAVAALAAVSPALAQPPAPADTKSSQSNAQSEAGEPRATTSPDAATQNGAGEGSDAATTKAPVKAASGAGGPASHSQAATPAPSKPAAGGGANTGGKPGAVDRLNLGTATVTGDREQPKVMYIVPWKRSDIGDLSGKPMNSLLDEALAPIDREEFKRQVVYYQAVRADAAQNGAAKTPAQGEK
jgi:hypothetical protein